MTGTAHYTLVADDITPAQLAQFTKHRSVAVDSETLGLNIKTDKLCLVQLSTGDGTALLVKFSANNYAAPNLKKLLTDPAVLKIFHFARFDMAVFYFYLQVMTNNIYCTKIASKILRPQAAKHSLSNLVKDLLDITLNKEQQVSNWAAELLSPAQLAYAASDVLYLHKIKEKMDSLGTATDRPLVAACHQFLSTRLLLDLHGFDKDDIFSHH